MYLINSIGSFLNELNTDTDGDGLSDYVEKEILKTDHTMKDTDGDGNADCLEIMMKYISFDDDGNIILPTYEEISKSALKNYVYGTKGLDDLALIMKKRGIDISKLRILPLISNPAIEDSDGDGIKDNEDTKSSSVDVCIIKDNLIDDTHIFESSYSVRRNSPFLYGDISAINVYDSNEIVAQKPKLTFVLKADKTSFTSYKIKPDENSDYCMSFDISSGNDFEIEIYPLIGENVKRYNKKVNVDTVKKDGIKECRFTLIKDINYEIDVKFNPFSFKSQSYTFSLEQDNWVNCRYGAIASYDDNFKPAIFSSAYMPKFLAYNYFVYLSGELSYDIGTMWFNSNQKNNNNKISASYTEYTKDYSAEMWKNNAELLSVNLSNALTMNENNSAIKISDINSWLNNRGADATIGGFITMLLKLESDNIPNALTLIGTGCTIISDYNTDITKFRGELSDALALNKYNIAIGYYGGIEVLGLYKYDCDSWETHHYVNKYNSGARYNIDEITKMENENIS